MNDASISLRLIGDSRIYAPGQSLHGEFFVDTSEPREIKAVELSVLWCTEGKGEEDMAVHHFQRFANESGEVDFRRTQTFQTELPNSPLSYDGVLVRIHWCVRVRVFLRRGRDVVTQQPFQLGQVPRARLVEQPV